MSKAGCHKYYLFARFGLSTYGLAVVLFHCAPILLKGRSGKAAANGRSIGHTRGIGVDVTDGECSTAKGPPSVHKVLLRLNELERRGFPELKG